MMAAPRGLLLRALLGGALLAVASGQITGFVFPSNLSTWTRVGSTSAVTTPGRVVLTSSTNQAGAFWAPNMLPTFRSWNASFVVRTTNPISGGADGFGFVVHTDSRGRSAIGSAGTSVGWGGSSAISPSYGIFGRNYQSSAGLGWTGAMGVVTSSSAPSAISWGSGTPTSLNASVWYDVCPAAPSNGCRGTMTYQVYNPVSRAWYRRTEVISLAQTLTEPWAYYGFTASTGGSAWTHTITDINVEVYDDAPCPSWTTPVGGYQDFGTWSPVGSAKIGFHDCAILTDSTNQAGAMWAPFMHDPRSAFNATFTITLFGSNGADGVAFVMHNDPRGLAGVGDGGSSVGAMGVTPLTPSVGVHFQDYQSTAVGWRVGIGNLAVPWNNPPATTVWGAVTPTSLRVTVRYNPETCTMTATGFNFANSLTYTSSASIPLAAMLRNQLSDSVYLGFTGGTGGAAWTHIISNFSFSAGPAYTARAVNNSLYDFSKWTRNGAAEFCNNNLALTSWTYNAGSAYAPEQIRTDRSFTLTATLLATNAVNGGADGMTIVLHNNLNGSSALGFSGGSLGAMQENNNGYMRGLDPAVGVVVNTLGTTQYQGGLLPIGNAWFQTAKWGQTNAFGTSGMGTALTVQLIYDACQCQLTLRTGQNGGTTYTTTAGMNLYDRIGGPLAYIGATAGTGANSWTHSLTSWNFVPGAWCPYNNSAGACSAHRSTFVTDFRFWIPNGDVTIRNTNFDITMTDNLNQKSAAWAPIVVSAHQSWRVSVNIYINTAIGVGGDGLAFVVHNDPRGRRALGAAGGAIGLYDSPGTPLNASVAILNSAGFLIRDFNQYVGGLGVFMGSTPRDSRWASNFTRNIGSVPTNGIFHYFSYDACANVMRVTTSAGYSESMNINLRDTLGSPTLTMGFTSGTGLAKYTHTLSQLNFNYELFDTWNCPSSPTASASGRPSATTTTSGSVSASVAPTFSTSSSGSASASGSGSGSPSSSPSSSVTPTAPETPSQTPSITPSASASAMSTITGSNTASITPSPTGSNTASITASPTGSITPSASSSETPTPTSSISTGGSPSGTPSQSGTGTATASITPSVSSSATPSQTPTHTASITASPTASPTPSPTGSGTASITASPTASITPSVSASGTASNTASPTATVSGTPTGTSSGTGTLTGSGSGSPTTTTTLTATPSQTATETSTASQTPSGMRTPTASESFVLTRSNTPSVTSTRSLSPSFTSTPSVTPSNPYAFYRDLPLDSYQPAAERPPVFKHVTVSERCSCGLTDEGQARCWGDATAAGCWAALGGNVSEVDSATGVAFRFLALPPAGAAYLLAVRALPKLSAGPRVISCFARGTAESACPAGFTAVSADEAQWAAGSTSALPLTVTAQDTFTCALLSGAPRNVRFFAPEGVEEGAGGAFECTGSDVQAGRLPARVEGNFTQLTSTPVGPCALNRSGQVQCWRRGASSGDAQRVVLGSGGSPWQFSSASDAASLSLGSRADRTTHIAPGAVYKAGSSASSSGGLVVGVGARGGVAQAALPCDLSSGAAACDASLGELADDAASLTAAGAAVGSHGGPVANVAASLSCVLSCDLRLQCFGADAAYSELSPPAELAEPCAVRVPGHVADAAMKLPLCQPALNREASRLAAGGWVAQLPVPARSVRARDACELSGRWALLSSSTAAGSFSSSDAAGVPHAELRSVPNQRSSFSTLLSAKSSDSALTAAVPSSGFRSALRDAGTQVWLTSSGPMQSGVIPSGGEVALMAYLPVSAPDYMSAARRNATPAPATLPQPDAPSVAAALGISVPEAVALIRSSSTAGVQAPARNTTLVEDLSLSFSSSELQRLSTGQLSSDCSRITWGDGSVWAAYGRCPVRFLRIRRQVSGGSSSGRIALSGVRITDMAGSDITRRAVVLSSSADARFCGPGRGSDVAAAATASGAFVTHTGIVASPCGSALTDGNASTVFSTLPTERVPAEAGPWLLDGQSPSPSPAAQPLDPEPWVLLDLGTELALGELSLTRPSSASSEQDAALASAFVGLVLDGYGGDAASLLLPSPPAGLTPLRAAGLGVQAAFTLSVYLQHTYVGTTASWSDLGSKCGFAVLASASITPSPSATPSVTSSRTANPTPSRTPSQTPSISGTASITVSSSGTPSNSRTSSATPSQTSTVSASSSVTPSPTPSNTPLPADLVAAGKKMAAAAVAARSAQAQRELEAATAGWRLDSAFTSLMGYGVPDAEWSADVSKGALAWEPFVDVGSGVSHLAYCFGSSPYACDVHDWVLYASGAGSRLTNARTVDGARAALSGVVPGSIVYGTVAAVNGAGLVTLATSDGVKLDNRPPFIERVLDTGAHFLQPAYGAANRAAQGTLAYLSPVDIDCDAAMSGIGASWADTVQGAGISEFRWSVGTSPGAEDILPWTTVGRSVAVFNSTLQLPAGMVLYTSAMAVGVGGQTSVAHSDGVRLLSTNATAGADERLLCVALPPRRSGA